MLTQYSLKTETAQKMRRLCGAYIRGLRIDAGLTQAQVAKALNYQYYTMISQVETGKARIPPEDYAKWASILGVDLRELAKTILFYMDPFTHHALFGGDHPLVAVERDALRHKRNDGATDDAGLPSA